MKKGSRDLPTILNDLYDEIFGNIDDTKEISGVVKLKKVVVESVGDYGKTGYWVKDLIIHYGWFSSTEEKGWTYCETRNEAKRVKARNKKEINEKIWLEKHKPMLDYLSSRTEPINITESYITFKGE